MKKFNYTKILGIGISAFLLVFAGVSLVMAEETNKVYNSKKVEVGYYEEFTSAQVSELRNVDDEEGNHITPDEKQGYVFAGWYGKSDCQSDSALTNEAINTMLASEESENTTFYAKFVSADILNVKAQLQGGTDSLSETSILRFVTTVDDLDYLEVGFNIVLDGKTYTSNTETVYKRLFAVGTTEEESTLLPTEFHAGSRYFMAVNLTGIPADVFAKEATATPYWVTCDGTKVENTDVETKSVVQGMPTVCEARVTEASGENTRYYSTLEKAFTVSNSANSYLAEGDTITVIQDDVEIAEQLYVYESVTLTNEAGRDVVVKRADTLTAGSFIDYTSNLTVKGTVSQNDGTGSLTFDGDGKTNTKAGIKSDVTSSNLSLDNITIKNIVTTQSGGAVRSWGKATITGCTFENNILNQAGSDAATGAAVYHRGNNTLTVSNCTFTSNQATAGDGGALYVFQGDATISGSRFESNSSAGANGGGAIYVRVGTTTISDTDFISNSATSGGAVYNYKATKVTINGTCEFSGNSAENGGALYVFRTHTTVSGSTFTSNTSTEANGGAIYFGADTETSKTLKLTSCTFESNNTATTGNGGAVYMNYGTATVSGSTFEKNGTTGANLGGAIYVNQGETTISGSDFSLNESTTKGGAIFYGENTENVQELTLASCTFDSNDTASAGFGGAVYVNSGTAGISGSTFTTNGTTGADMGGAIYVNAGTTTISGSGFNSNKATSNGGAVYDNLGTVTIKEICTFEGNSAANGGAIYVYQGTTGISNSTFTSNASTEANGGAIYFGEVNENVKELTLTGCTFTSNNATDEGGAVYNCYGKITIKDKCTFERNTAAGGGAALRVYQGRTDISDSSFTSNSSAGTSGGGAIYYRGTSESNKLTLTGCTFISNTATGSDARGGAVYVYNGMAEVSESKFSSNGLETTSYGGAIGVRAGTTTVSNTEFDSNKVATNGGALFNLQGALIVNSDCTFKSNTAQTSGGAIYVDKAAATLEVNASTFTSNRANITTISGVGGGAIFTNAATVTVSNSDFEQNVARRGGAIYENTGTVTIKTGCMFSGNTAVRGGAVFISTEGIGSVTDAIFVGNGTAELTTAYGGAIHCANAMTIDGCVFDKNIATNSSAGYSSTDTFDITNTTLINQVETDFSKLTLLTQANESATTNSVDNIHDADDDHQLSLLTNIDETEFEAYCDRIESMGFVLKSENTMGEETDTVARTYYSTERGYMLHTYWVEYSQEVRTQVAAMDESMLSPLRKLSGTEEESETVSDTSCTPLFHQLEALNYDDTTGIQSLEGGMGYIIRLKDGRFIIIDGGHRTETDPDNPSQTTNVNSDTLEILAFLAKNTPDPKNIVIASWIFTHTHSDHSGAFVNFTKYLDLHIDKVNYDFGTSIEKVTLESVMLNACDTEEQMTYCGKTGTEEILTDIIPNYWEAKWESEPAVYKPLTGQVYTFADTSIEILHTMSDFLPNTIQYEEDGKGGDYNIQSVVSIVDVDNTADRSDRFFIMGDTTATACNEMSKRYGEYMACDYVQVAHHGYNEFNTGHLNCRRHGATQEIYEYILKDDSSTIVMWPTSDKRFTDKTQTTIPINYWLVTEAPVKAHWIAESVSDENRTIEFE